MHYIEAGEGTGVTARSLRMIYSAFHNKTLNLFSFSGHLTQETMRRVIEPKLMIEFEDVKVSGC